MRTRVTLSRSLRYLLAWTPTIAAARALPAQRPVSDAVLQRGSLSFLGHATVGDFVGVTSSVTGVIIGGRDYSVTRGFVEASVRTLVTGNERRDRDLRESMEVARYPMMRFDLSAVTPVPSASVTPDSIAMMLHGALTIHGVTQRVDLAARVTRAGDTTRVTTRFPLDLGSYDIRGLTKMFGLLRMQNEIEVRVDLLFLDAPTQWANP
ncbi:MAG TPA: YceI family protein [Gemmatimonadaceae bacterium]|jgi:polyisoprenoid-binding protein YceI